MQWEREAVWRGNGGNVMWPDLGPPGSPCGTGTGPSVWGGGAAQGECGMGAGRMWGGAGRMWVGRWALSALCAAERFKPGEPEESEDLSSL